jgi:xanthine dehydrogenase accessory factor
MKKHLPLIQSWATANKHFAVATVIQTWGSSPRPVGSNMLISNEMEMTGSVSGGCVEGAVLREAMPLLASGESKRLTYGVTDDDAWAVGLSCGGSIQVFLEPFLLFDGRESEQTAARKLLECLENNAPCVLLTRLADGLGKHFFLTPDGVSHGEKAPDTLAGAALDIYRKRRHGIIEAEGENWFVRVFPRRSQLLLIGAAHITADLVRLAQLFDFETIVIDPRGVFASKTQFPVPPDQLLETYPSEVLPDLPLDAYTYAVVLSHDPKIDDNALHILLKSEVAYIGALGSKKTHAKRMERLKNAGFSEEGITRIHAPIGVDIHAQTPAEIALSIMGEVIKVKNAFLKA